MQLCLKNGLDATEYVTNIFSCPHSFSFSTHLVDGPALRTYKAQITEPSVFPLPVLHCTMLGGTGIVERFHSDATMLRQSRIPQANANKLQLASPPCPGSAYP